MLPGSSKQSSWWASASGLEFRATTDCYQRGLPAELSIAIAYSETSIGDACELAKMMPGRRYRD
jgi:hypothetical protein